MCSREEKTQKDSSHIMCSDSSTSSQGAGDYEHKDKNVDDKQVEEKECISPCRALAISSTSSSSLSEIPAQGFCSQVKPLDRQCGDGPPDLLYEMNIAKSIMQQYSSLSGNNLYDHLCDIIKRVIDERPPNVIDFFEEFSRNVREQKFYLPERFPPTEVFEANRMECVAKRQLLSMKLPYERFDEDGPTGNVEDEQIALPEELNIDIIDIPKRMFVVFSERVQQLQFYWNQCGFSISTDDIFLLACSMDRLQTHPAILQCRFWGVVNGLKASYYVVEASLTKDEISKRIKQMELELHEKLQAQLRKECCQLEIPPHIGPELSPGFYGWENFPPEELEKMTPHADPIPLTRQEEVYDVPPELIGSGLNRYSYFVVNSLLDEWLELPIVTPKQIVISRQIKKFLTGDIENEFCSYPCFPGKEKHYLRALIARITCGTSIAPRGYYRKMTKKERRIFEQLDDEEGEDEEEENEEIEENEEEEEEEREHVTDNDIMALRNEKYSPSSLDDLLHPGKWVHSRPHILKQGRIVWFNEEKARKEREREIARLRKEQMGEGEDEGEIEENEDEEEEGEEEEVENIDNQEYGPHIFSSCGRDVVDDFVVPWSARLTSQFVNKSERVLVMRSNVWPGAFTFTFEKICESIYMGWGHKYNARNMPFKHLPPIAHEYPHGDEDFIETTDPSVADEDAYKMWLLNKEKHAVEDAVEEEQWSLTEEQEIENDK